MKEKFNNSGLDKDLFINLITNNSVEFDANQTAVNNDLTQRGELRKQQK